MNAPSAKCEGFLALCGMPERKGEPRTTRTNPARFTRFPFLERQAVAACQVHCRVVRARTQARG